MDILKTTNLRKYYGSGDTVVKALDGVNLSVADGEFAAMYICRDRRHLRQREVDAPAHARRS